MAKKLNGVVAEILEDGMSVVINKGATSGVAEGMHYLIYNEGEEIMDPETGNSLGTLEIVCGKGVVVHVQDTMATIESCKKDTSVSKITRPRFLGGLSALMPETEERAVRPLPFDNVKKGSLAKCLG